MLSAVLPLDHELSHRSRLRTISAPLPLLDWVEVPFLLLMGVGAAWLTAFVHLRAQIPGHVILFGVVPMSCGLAVAPRHRSGALMGLSSVLALCGFAAAGTASLRLGAAVSLGLLGPLLDWAARRASSGKRLYVAFAAAGLADNAVTFVVKMLEKHSGANLGSRPYAEWFSIAPVSFALCGLLAGLIGAALFFQFSEGESRPGKPDA